MSGTLHQTAAQALLSGADPFSDRISGDVWRPPAAHVPGLNGGVRAAILREAPTAKNVRLDLRNRVKRLEPESA